jgi:zinc protease
MGNVGVVQTRLRNGLRVHLKEIRTAPLVSCWIWYQVGSRNEKPGETGISHWVEHMQFKETPKYPAGVLDRAINRIGASWNAGTWIDWTTYYENMPAGRIELALDLESDRMVNSIYEPTEVESERTVIISERQGNENEPTFRLAEEVQATVFRVHSYHHEIIGDLADLQTITRDDLYTHYRRYYTPSNAVLAIAGDFRASTLQKRIRKYFGDIPAGEKFEFVPRMEPQQYGEKRVTVEGPGEAPFVEVAYHAPAGGHPDFIPFTILDSLLTGATSLNLYGGGISNKTSRLYRQLVEGDLAAAVSGSLAATIDPYIYSVRASVRSDREPEQVMDVITQEIDKLLQEKVKRSEVSKAIKQARALFAYGSESISNQAFWLGRAEMFANYEWFQTYLDRISEVTSEKIIQVAQKYLLSHNRTVGIYRPVGGGSNG